MFWAVRPCLASCPVWCAFSSIFVWETETQLSEVVKTFVCLICFCAACQKNQRVTSPPNRCSIKLQGARQTAQTTAETKKRNPRAINKKTQRDLWIIIVCLVFSVLSGSLGYACWFGLGGGSHPLGFVTCSTKTY